MSRTKDGRVRGSDVVAHLGACTEAQAWIAGHGSDDVARTIDRMISSKSAVQHEWIRWVARRLVARDALSRADVDASGLSIVSIGCGCVGCITPASVNAALYGGSAIDRRRMRDLLVGALNRYVAKNLVGSVSPRLLDRYRREVSR